jgi:hypothetical protein
MISRHIEKLLKHVGFTITHNGTKHKERYEVVYKGPFHNDILGEFFSLKNEIKNAPYEDSPATTVCHFFEKDLDADYIRCIRNDLETYIEVLLRVVEILKDEEWKLRHSKTLDN